MKLFGRKVKEETVKELTAFVSGQAIVITEVNDPVFSAKTLGDGMAIKPNVETIYAPCAGIVSLIAKDSNHAIGMTLNNDAEILIHVGLDTVSLNGKGFKVYVKEGQKVKQGERLMEFDKKLIESEGFDSTCVFVLTNSDDFFGVRFFDDQRVVQKETVICSFL